MDQDNKETESVYYSQSRIEQPLEKTGLGRCGAWSFWNGSGQPWPRKCWYFVHVVAVRVGTRVLSPQYPKLSPRIFWLPAGDQYIKCTFAATEDKYLTTTPVSWNIESCGLKEVPGSKEKRNSVKSSLLQKKVAHLLVMLRLFAVVYLLTLVWLLCNLMGCSPPGSSVHGIFQAKILEQIAIFYSRGSSQPRDWTRVLCFLHWQADSLPLSHQGGPSIGYTREWHTAASYSPQCFWRMTLLAFVLIFGHAMLSAGS